MANFTPADELALLPALRLSLLQHRPRTLGPHEGPEAFQQHKLLAAAIHRTTRLDARNSESETDSWMRYITNYFPPGKNGAGDAKLLFADWRVPLLKDDTPGASVPITHGQPAAHWQREQERLLIDLESMWADFASSVDAFIEDLRARPDRRAIVLARWQQTEWSVQMFSTAQMPVTGASAITASATPGSVTKK